MVLTIAVILSGIFLLQAPTPDQAGSEIAALAVTVLGIVGSAVEQIVKKAVAPFDNASPIMKSVITLMWGFGLAWISGKVPWLAAQLPSSPSGLGTASNGLVLTLAMMGIHKLTQVIKAPTIGGTP